MTKIALHSALPLLLLGANSWGDGQVVARPAGPAPNIEFPPTPVPVSRGIPEAFQERRNIHVLPVLAVAEIQAADAELRKKIGNIFPGPERVGVVRSVGANPLSIARGSALKKKTPDGADVWTLAIRSPGAFGTRLHFSGFDVGAGSVLVYAEGASGIIARGPYTRKGPNKNGEFWTSSLPGDTVFIEVSGTDNPIFEIKEIVHFDKHPGGVGAEEAQGLLPCQADANCFSTDTAGRDATGQMNYNLGAGSFLCSGTVLNDDDPETSVPYFLTAFHCLSTQAAVDTLEVVWRWGTDSCNGALPDFFALPRTDGGTLLETNPTNTGNDMTFIRLDGVAVTDQAGSTNAALPSSVQGYHHPAGSWKRGTTSTNNRVVTPCLNTPTSNYHYVVETVGVTEGGSSGSAIFDGGSRVMGQLLGGCCPRSLNWPGNPCCLAACSNRNLTNAVYGRFDVSFPFIDPWLVLGGTVRVDGGFVGTELGTPANPFNTVNEANNLAWDGARIKIKAGSYNETLIFSKELLVLADGGTVTIGQ
ncbi:MAG: hypothetical protein V3W34_01665 [Phycisphaerae bacterium]